MKKIETFAFITCPFIFFLALLFIGIYALKQHPETPQGIILICSSLICACLWGTNTLLAKLIEKP